MHSQTRRVHAAQHNTLARTLLAWLSWLVTGVIDAWEQILQGVLRESLQLSQRTINGVSAWTLSVFNRDYKAQLRGRWTTLQEQYSWWGQTETGRGSTLNAVLARKYDQDGAAASVVAAAAAGRAAAAARAGVAGPHEGLRHRKPTAAGSSSDAAAAPQHPVGAHSTARHSASAQHGGLSEIEPLPAGPSPQRPPGAVPAGSAEAGGQQWWGQGATWLSDIADEATEAAAAAQEAASAAVQQAANTMTQAVEEAAATAASWARSMRAVFVEPPAGWGVHEAIKQTGLLEDVSLYGQLLISRIFDKLRWLLGKLTFSAIAQTPTAAAAGGCHVFGTGAAGGAGPGRQSLLGRLRSPQHAAAAAAAAAGRGQQGVGSFSSGYGRGARLKLRSVTSVDLPHTHRLSLEAEESEEGAAEDESGLSDTSSSGAYDDVQEDASSEASCSSTSSWQGTSAQQHAATAAAAALRTRADSSAAAGLSDLAGPPLTVRVPQRSLEANAGQVPAAAARQHDAQQQAGAAAVGGAFGDVTPFATQHVQQRRQADITQQPQHVSGAAGGPVAAAAGGAGRSPGSASRARAGRGSSKGSSSSSARHKQRVGPGAPEGLSVVLPVRSRQRLQRSHSGPAVSVLRDVSSAGQVIRMAGYPLEVHEVVTPDGYLLRMERIPQPSSTDAVFMMHGVLDTSLTWVAGGITGSQAFAAWDRGFDVWLGTSRSNPPHEAADPARRGSRYWVYSHNEVGMYDIGEQVDHIHAVKMRELTALGRNTSSSKRASSSGATAAASGSRAGRHPSGRRSSSRRPVPEHGDILEGVVDADVLVGIQHVRPAAAAAGEVEAGGGKGGQHAGGAAAAAATAARVSPQPAAWGGEGAASGTHKASSGPAAVSSGGSCGRAAAVDMNRAQSAAEIDQAAAADAAAAFTRHRAALVAAGISPDISSSAVASAVSESMRRQPADEPQQQQQQQQQQQASAQGVLAPLTPTATGAAAAAARAANALGSAVANAAAAAGSMMGMAGAGPGEEAGHQDGASTRPNSSADVAVVAKPAASGLLERLLGGTVPVGRDDEAVFGGRRGGFRAAAGLQTQGSGMRHVASAPDVAALAEAGDAAGSSSSSSRASSVELGMQGGAEAAVAAAAGSGGGAAAARRRARRGSCPYFTGTVSDVEAVAGAGQQTSAVSAAEQQPEPAKNVSAPQQQQQEEGVSPFSLQQPTQQQQPEPAAQRQQQEPQQEPQQQPRQSSRGVSSPAASTAAAAAPAAAAHAGSGGVGGRVVRSSDWGMEPRPYNLRVVCHSLGGLLVLIYCTQRARAGRPHHISRLIMLSPAGYHPVIPSVFKPLVWTWRPLMLWMHLVWRQQGFPVHLPTFVARMLAFKLSIDTSKLPAVGDLLRSLARLLLGGDQSAWDRALLMPHYTGAGMPLLSSRQVLHFVQLYLTGRCQLFDYGSEAANVAAYQQRSPPVVSDAYHMLRDVPVHLVAGQHDGVIPASNIRHHYAAMRAAGMDVSYREFDYGHLDMTFSAKEELGWYVMSLLMRT